MDRYELGERLLNWHGSMSDPIYAVGSFYIDGKKYSDEEIVLDCLSNLNHSLYEFQQMKKGELVMVRRYGSEVDLRAFAGYTDEEIEENVSDLVEIVSAVGKFFEEDYR